MKITLILFLGLGVGFLLGRSFSPQNQYSTPIDYQAWSSDGVKKISTKILPSEQLAEAERYYGKAVVLFLASLYHLNHPTQVTIANSFEDKTEVTSEISSPNEVTSAPIKNQKIETLSPAQKIAAKKEEEDLNRLITYRKSTFATKMSPEVRKMNGSFEGTFTQEAGKNKGRIDKIEIDIMFDMRDGKLQGQARVALTDPSGKLYSNSNGDGSNQTLRLVAGSKDMIYVETAPGEFIIMDVSRPNKLVGKYYDRDGVYFGSVQLWRK